jgi:Pyruvate/2-oxoacid:ferredoxin oxidoreductase gamma subunit
MINVPIVNRMAMVVHSLCCQELYTETEQRQVRISPKHALDSIHLAQDRHQRRALVNTVMTGFHIRMGTLSSEE